MLPLDMVSNISRFRYISEISYRVLRCPIQFINIISAHIKADIADMTDIVDIDADIADIDTKTYCPSLILRF